MRVTVPKSIKPGTSLDELVGEVVMGWTKFEGWDNIPWSIRCPEADPDRWHFSCIWAVEVQDGVWLQRACRECGTMPLFSSEWNDTWKVMSRLIEVGAQPVSLEYMEYQPSWYCEIRGITTSDGVQLHCQTHDEPKMAICLAALQAFGVEVG